MNFDSYDEERMQEMEHELENFNRERERIKAVLGKFGGTADIRKHRIFNYVILGVTLTLFVLEMTTHFMPHLISLEIGVLLISLKVIMLIHSMAKQNHFEFWMLNSIEFRVNELSKDFRKLKQEIYAMQEHENAAAEASTGKSAAVAEGKE